MPTDLTQATLKESNSAENAPQRNLKNAREKLKLSAADIANKLNLTVTLIEKIETNDFTDIATIFAKGYVRSYAKLVKLSNENTAEIISLIKDTDTQANLKIPRATRFIKEKKRWPKVLLYCLIIALALVLASYWQNTHTSKNKNKNQESNQANMNNTAMQDDDFADITSLSAPSTIEIEADASTENIPAQRQAQDQEGTAH